jgi:hypothetical protein
MKKWTVGLAAAFTATLFATGTKAQDVRDFCPDRPGLGTPACTLEQGRLAAELGLIDWTLDRPDGNRTDTIAAGDLLVRYGVSDRLEVQLGWTAFGHVRDRFIGLVEKSAGPGDVLVAVRRNLRNPDGSGFAVALMPFVTLPTGGSTLGVGDWGAGLLLPISSELAAGFQLGFTGSIEAAVDEDGDGRHLAYGGVMGLDVPVGNNLSATFELSAQRDEDVSGTKAELLGGLSAAWSPGSSLQLDVGANIGMNRDAPDVQLYLGVARPF